MFKTKGSVVTHMLGSSQPEVFFNEESMASLGLAIESQNMQFKACGLARKDENNSFFVYKILFPPQECTGIETVLDSNWKEVVISDISEEFGVEKNEAETMFSQNLCFWLFYKAKGKMKTNVHEQEAIHPSYGNLLIYCEVDENLNSTFKVYDFENGVCHINAPSNIKYQDVNIEDIKKEVSKYEDNITVDNLSTKMYNNVAHKNKTLNFGLYGFTPSMNDKF